MYTYNRLGRSKFLLALVLVTVIFFVSLSKLHINFKTKTFVNKCSCKLLYHLSPPIDNFQHFPCLKNLTPSADLIEHGKCVRTVNLPSVLLDDNQDCVEMKFGRGTPICAYPIEEDIHVSRALVGRGYWEEEFVNPMLQILKKRPGMTLLDLGCNIGVYTLSAAQYTNNVICVDANFENLYRVSRSIKLGNLQENVTLIWNAISEKHETVVLKKQLENVGGAEIDIKTLSVSGCDIAVNAIVLDDLKELFRDKEVYIKMDIQSQEHNALKYGREFFKLAKVRYVQLELVMHLGLHSGREIVQTMAEYGFEAYADCGGKQKLEPGYENTYRLDVCYISTNWR